MERLRSKTRTSPRPSCRGSCRTPVDSGIPTRAAMSSTRNPPGRTATGPHLFGRELHPQKKRTTLIGPWDGLEEMAKGVQNRRVQVASAILVIVLLAGFTLWLASGPSNCKRAAAPILEALERYHKTHGRYPASLDDLVHEKWIPAIP